MRRDEAFVGEALVAFLGGPPHASLSDGEDPPDLYLTLSTSRVGVEVTRLSQFTFEPDGSFGSRATQDAFGLRLLNELNANVGPRLPDGVSLLLSLSVPVRNASRFRKALTHWVEEIAANPAEGFEREREIEGVRTSLSVIPPRPSGKRIVGIVANENSSADIGLNARLVLEERVRTKSEICAALLKPVWLALLNDYWLADAETYAAASRQLSVEHCFERIFLVSDEGLVSELGVRA